MIIVLLGVYTKYTIITMLCIYTCTIATSLFTTRNINQPIKHSPNPLGLSQPEREANYKAWKRGTTLIIVATNAFGMGIDKHNVRFVLHASVPKSIEAFTQESGRAGRDGQEAHSVVMYRVQDVVNLCAMVGSSTADAIKHVLAMAAFCEDRTTCRRVSIGASFGEPFDVGLCEEGCDVCGDRWTRMGVLSDVTLPALNLVRGLTKVLKKNAHVTLNNLAAAWRAAGPEKDGMDPFRCPQGWSVEMCETLVMHLLRHQVLGVKLRPNKVCCVGVCVFMCVCSVYMYIHIYNNYQNYYASTNHT